jgi:hypothetical protein
MRLKRLLAGPAIAGALVLTQLVGASPASAAIGDLACNYVVGSFNACLRFLPVPEAEGNLTAHVGMDLYTQFGSQYGAFQAALYAERDGPDLFLGYLNLLPGWPASDSQGLGVEFSRTFSRTQLDVNTGGEALYVEIFYDDPWGNRLSKRTGVVRGDFSPGGGGGGGGGCFEECK